MAVLALGSNTGDRRGNLLRALVYVSDFSNVLKRSFIYETPPWGFEAQGNFLNAALLIETPLSPEALLLSCKKIEKALGREESFKNAPRPIDVDIIFYDGFFLKTADIEIPHPRWEERDFVVSPLIDLFEGGDILFSEYFLDFKKIVSRRIRVFDRFGAF